MRRHHNCGLVLIGAHHATVGKRKRLADKHLKKERYFSVRTKILYNGAPTFAIFVEFVRVHIYSYAKLNSVVITYTRLKPFNAWMPESGMMRISIAIVDNRGELFSSSIRHSTGSLEAR